MVVSGKQFSPFLLAHFTVYRVVFVLLQEPKRPNAAT